METDSLALAASAGPSWLSLLLRLLLLAALLGGALWLLRRLKAGQRGLPGDERPLEVLSAVSLGARRQAVLLRVAGRVLLLGLGEGGVRPLGTFTSAEAEELIARAGRGPHPFALRFFEARRRAGDGPGGDGSVGDGTPPA
jgi:flagellar biogenesis protein FliO